MKTTRLIVFPNLDVLNTEVADRFAQLARQHTKTGRRFFMAISGGETPKRLYKRLAAEPYRSRIPWRRVEIFWTDERCVPASHPESNFGNARRLFLSKIPIPKDNIHRMPTELGDPLVIAEAYEQTLRKAFQRRRQAKPVFDLILAGVGADGHVASLFPGSAAVLEKRHWVTAARRRDADVPRVTLTLPVLNCAKHLIFLVAGRKKAAMLFTAFGKKRVSRQLPVSQVQPGQGSAIWFVDRQAAQRIC